LKWKPRSGQPAGRNRFHPAKTRIIKHTSVFGYFHGNNPHGQQLTSTSIQETTSWFHIHGTACSSPLNIFIHVIPEDGP
jgi:hypothetical protein